MVGDAREEDVRSVVSAWLRQLDEQLAHLMSERRSLDVKIEDLKRRLDEATPFARSLGIEVSSHSTGGTFVAGSRSTRLPPRRSEFATITLQEAAERILAEQSGVPVHANVIVSRIYEPGTPAQFKAAKSSVVPALSAGVNEGKWVRTEPNTFALHKTEGEAAVGSGAPPQS